jgi:hypothetical protein
LKVVKPTLAAFGLAKDNIEMDSALKAYWRWHQDEIGNVSVKSNLKDAKGREKFRFHILKSIEALKKNDTKEYARQQAYALEIPEFEEMSFKEQTKAISSYMRSRKLVSSLSDEEQESLINRIGENAFQRLVDFDDMLEAEAK